VSRGVAPSYRLALTGASMVIWAAACTFSASVPVGAPSPGPDAVPESHPLGDALQSLLDQTVRDGLPGVALFLKTPAGQWNGASGYAGLEEGAAMTPSHVLHGASVTKMYVATTTLLLAEDGRLNLDAPIGAYLPESVYRPIPNGSVATVRQLLGHTSGIPDFSGSMAFEMDFLNDPLGWYSETRLLGYLHGQSAIFEPGEGYFYSNANYFLLAMILDEVAREGHGGLIVHRILDPLGLDATFYRERPGWPNPPGLVNSYQDLAGDGRFMNVTDLATHSPTLFPGGAGVMATATDFARFLEALMGGEILGPDALAEMRAHTTSPRYGLGLHFLDTPWGPAIGHSGGDMGVLAQVRHFPERDATIVLLSNGGDGGIPERLFSRLWDEVVAAALANE